MRRSNVAARLDPDAMPPWIAGIFAAGMPARHVLAGINDDDCAVLSWPEGILVITTDFLNARPIALELKIGDMRTLGRLVVAANLSDLCGSGATPKALLIGVTMPRDSSPHDFRRLMLGVKHEAGRWGVPVVGGDTKLGENLALLGVAIGSAASRENLFLKNAARPGDLIWVSGPLGSCNAAVMGLKEGGHSKTWIGWARRTLTVPSLPLALAKAMADSKLGRGGIDISDGLGADLLRLCTASGVGAIVEVEGIPIERPVLSVARRNGLPGWAYAFGVGGDFQFLVTAGPASRREVEALGFRCIGRLTRERSCLLRFGSGVMRPLPTGGHRDSRNLSFYDEIRSLMEAFRDA